MAAPVNESKLLNPEIKAEMERLAENMTRERLLALQDNAEAATSDERLYVRLFKIMCNRGLKGACTPPPPSGPTIRPVARLQQHHPHINQWGRKNQLRTYVGEVPSIFGSH